VVVNSGHHRVPRGAGGGADLRRGDRQLPGANRAAGGRSCSARLRVRRAVVTWFVVQARARRRLAARPALEAITGFLAIVVLLSC
jgi:hypothetical protein